MREKEWEAAHTVWLWLDLSASMDLPLAAGDVSKRDRGIVFLLALAELLATAGERVGLLGESDPMLARNAAERVARFLAPPTRLPSPIRARSAASATSC